MNVIDKLTHGMYVLTTLGAGCMVDAVSQVSAGDEPLVSVSVNKRNCTHEKLMESKVFTLSILGMDCDPQIIENFGFHSSRDYNKFEKFEFVDVEGIKTVKNTIGYLYCEVVDMIDAETHTIFIGRVKKSELFQDAQPMSYGYYREHKDELLKKVVTQQNKTAWVCTVCGYVYYGDEVPDGFKCPQCGVGKEYFRLMEN